MAGANPAYMTVLLEHGVDVFFGGEPVLFTATHDEKPQNIECQ